VTLVAHSFTYMNVIGLCLKAGLLYPAWTRRYHYFWLW